MDKLLQSEFGLKVIEIKNSMATIMQIIVLKPITINMFSKHIDMMRNY